MEAEYRRRPVYVKAVQFLPAVEADTYDGKFEAHGQVFTIDKDATGYCLVIGSVIVRPQDWLVKNPDGLLVTFGPELFEALFEPVP